MTTKPTSLQLKILNKMKRSTSQLRIIPLNGEIRAVLIDHTGKTYGIVRANTLRFLVRKNLIKKIVNKFDEISYGLPTKK